MLKVLLVEDDENHRRLMSRAFAAHAGEMTGEFAQNLDEAKSQIAKTEPDLVIVDFLLPDGRGVELLPNGNGELPYPVVLLTSHGDEEVAVEVMKSGALDYIVKSESTLLDIPHIALSSVRSWAQIRDRKQAEAALRESEARLRCAVEDAPYPIMIYADDGKVIRLNKMWTQLSGYAEDEITTLEDWTRRAFPERTDEVLESLRQVHVKPQRLKDEKIVVNTKTGGQRIWIFSVSPLGETPGGERLAITMAADVTEAEQLSEQLQYQATHDALTGLVNRREFEVRLERVLETTRSHATEHALCYLDLDQFKIINDTCGHMAGDELLRQLSTELGIKVRKRDTLARLGGDEFGILLEHCSVEQAQRVAEVILATVSDFHFVWEEASYRIGVSIGVVPITGASGDISSVMRSADIACYAAKDEGRNRVHLYREDDLDLTERHREIQWVPKITQALDEDRFHLLWQPIKSLNEHPDPADDGHHYELLLRMRDRDGQTILPSAFLPAAERYGLSASLDRWVISKALSWLGRHPSSVDQLHLCSINLCAQSLSDKEFLGFVTHAFRHSHIPPDKICFEINETAAIAHMTVADRFIRELKSLGCRFALDDFGNSLSSLAYLKRLPVDYLKIDGVFLKEIETDPVDLAMVKSINQIGQVMGKKTIAEAVESPSVLNLLRQIGVDYAQGFELGRPQPIP